MKKIFILLPIVAALTACGQGTGTGTQGGTTLGVAAGDQEAISRVKALQVSKNAAVNVSFPAAGVVASALAENVEKDQQDTVELRRNFRLMALSQPGAWFSIQDISKGAIEGLIKSVENVSAEDLDKAEAARGPDGRGLIKAIRSKDKQAAAAVNERITYRNLIAATMQPLNGWPVKVMGIPEEAARYIYHIQQSVEFSNAVITELASQISTAAWRDPAAAREAARIAFQNMPLEKLRAAWEAAKDLPEGFVVDGTGGPMHWTSANGDYKGDYKGDGAGWTLTRHGAPFFGASYLSGRQVTVGLASAISASTSKQSSTQSSAGNNSSLDAGSNSQVK